METCRNPERPFTVSTQFTDAGAARRSLSEFPADKSNGASNGSDLNTQVVNERRRLLAHAKREATRPDDEIVAAR
jgi:hypothetical protein